MASGTLASKITGQIRLIFLVMAVGTLGPLADAFDLANNIPTSLNLILTGGIFNAILVPQIVKAKASKNGNEQVNKLITFAGTFIFAITVILTLISPLIISIVAGNNWTSEQLNLAIMFGFYCIPQVFFYGLFTILGQLLASDEKFGAYSWAPVANNIISCIMLLLFITYNVKNNLIPDGEYYPELKDMNGTNIFLLAGGATIAIIIQSLCLLIPLIRSHVPFKPQWGIRGFGLRKIMSLSIWSFFMICLEQAVYMFYVHTASGAPSEAYVAGNADAFTSVAGNAAYTNAGLIFIIPHSLVTITLQTTLFTRISRAANNGDRKEAANITLFGAKNIISIICIFFAIYLVLSVPITRVLVPSANSYASIYAISHLVWTLSFMLIPIGVFQMTTRLFFAFSKMKYLFFVELVEHPIIALSVFIVTFFTKPEFFALDIAVCRVVGAWFGLCLILYSAKKYVLKISVGIRKVALLLIKALFAVALSSSVGYLSLHPLCNFLFANTDVYGLSWLNSLIICVIVATEIALIYFSACLILKVEFAVNLQKSVVNKLLKKG